MGAIIRLKTAIRRRAGDGVGGENYSLDHCFYIQLDNILDICGPEQA